MPECASNEKDRLAREKLRKRILSEIEIVPASQTTGIFPTLIKDHQYRSGERPGIPISDSQLKQFSSKLVRGITFIADGRYIDKPYKIRTVFAYPNLVEEFEAIVNRCGQRMDRGPGIIVRRAVVHDDPKMAMFCIDILGLFRIYSTIIR